MGETTEKKTADDETCEECKGLGIVQNPEETYGDDAWWYCECAAGDARRRQRRDEARATRRDARHRHVVARQPDNPWRKAILEVLDRALEDDLEVCVYTRGAQFLKQLVVELSPSIGIVRLAITCWSPDGTTSAGDDITKDEFGVNTARLLGSRVGQAVMKLAGYGDIDL